MTRTPEQLRMILVDPKWMEFSNYKTMPHLLVPYIVIIMYLLEKRGVIGAARGAGDMLDKCRAAGTPAPEWIEEDDGFTVVLRKLNFESAVPADHTPKGDPKGTQKTGMKTSMKTGMKTGMKTSDAILMLMREDAEISIDSLAARLCRARSSIIEQVTKLKRANRIRRVGPDKGGHWEVV